MGSVIDTIECPNCKQEAIIDFYYKSGEEITICSHCGYYKSITIKNREKNLNELTDDDWEVKEISNPYGSYRLKSKEGIATQLGILTSEEEFNELKSAVMEGWDDIDFCTVSMFVDGEIKTEHLK
jgi:Zn ribbon nucleic-acid-binding protein